SFTPAGRYTLTWINGGGNPPYSVPEILNSDSNAAPAPKMLPVCGKPAIGTALALNCTVGAAEAAPGSARASAPAATATRLMIVLRIPVLLLGGVTGRRDGAPAASPFP